MGFLRADTRAGRLHLGPKRWPMALGRAGAIHQDLKREGDDKTPLGRFWCEALYVRQDRMDLPPCALPQHSITQRDGWCDDTGAGAYNQHMTLPSPHAHETLMRDDGLYDALIVLSHNRWPAVPGYGSAIFLHIARETNGSLAPTRGCLALKKSDYLEMLSQLPARCAIHIV
ncbi:MAG: L,D-transpeptidase family protein [Pseudomonadota bacterium]